MKIYDTIFLDRDGTLNPDPGYINNLKYFDFFPFTISALKILNNYCSHFCIVSNQSGIGRGIIEESKLEEIHQYIIEEFAENNLPLLGIYFCPDHPDKATRFRKPGSGMFKKAAKEFNLDLTNSLMIGDADSDIIAGVKLGMDTMLVLTGKGYKTLNTLPEKFTPTYVAKNLLTGAEL